VRKEIDLIYLGISRVWKVTDPREMSLACVVFDFSDGTPEEKRKGSKWCEKMHGWMKEGK